MPVGLMNGSKRARNTPSLANQTTIYGIMGGLAPRVGTSDVAVYRHMLIKAGHGLPQLYNMPFAKQHQYLKDNKLLSVNPQCSGGVGRRNLVMHCRSSVGPVTSNAAQDSQNNNNNPSVSLSSELYKTPWLTEPTRNVSSTTDGLAIGFPSNPNVNWNKKNDYDPILVSLGVKSIGGDNSAEVWKLKSGDKTWTHLRWDEDMEDPTKNSYSSPRLPYAAVMFEASSGQWGYDICPLPLFVFMPSSGGEYNPGDSYLWHDPANVGNPIYFVTGTSTYGPDKSHYTVRSYICVKSGNNQPTVWRLLPGIQDPNANTSESLPQLL